MDFKKYPKLKKADHHQVVISNHIGWLDIQHVIGSKFISGFVAKYSTQKIPIVGSVAKSLQCIFFKRSNKDKTQIKKDITDRIELIKKSADNFNKILIFPEGTTTHGDHLLPFKKGAFLKPDNGLKLICMKVGGQFRPTMSITNLA